MSHIIDVKVKDEEGVEVDTSNLDAWELAAASLGGALVRNQKTYRCFSKGWVGDTPPPAGWDPSMWEKCEHAITFPGCRYEVGLVRMNGKLTPLFDYFTGEDRLKLKLGGMDAPLLSKAYVQAKRQVDAIARIRPILQAKRYRVAKQSVENGVVKLQVIVP